tara:strand:+ start:1069 stop:1224 length:156 start_codon:yes stop_codon:yes gene_type:complete
MDNVKNVLELIIALQSSGWSNRQIIDFAKTFHRIIREQNDDPDFIPYSDSD